MRNNYLHTPLEEKVSRSIKWIDTLCTSTEYKQGKNSLGSIENGFCCLGLGCYVTGIDFHYTFGDSYEFKLSTGLYNAGGKLKKGTFGEVYKNAKSLLALNDKLGLQFSEIGWLIKANLERLFEKDVALKLREHYG